MADAGQADEEALKIRRKLAQQNPDVYLPDLAKSLNDLGVLYRTEKRIDDARVAFKEA